MASVLCSFHIEKKTRILTVLMGMTWRVGSLLLAVTPAQVPTFQVTPTSG